MMECVMTRITMQSATMMVMTALEVEEVVVVVVVEEEQIAMKALWTMASAMLKTTMRLVDMMATIAALRVQIAHIAICLVAPAIVLTPANPLAETVGAAVAAVAVAVVVVMEEVEVYSTMSVFTVFFLLLHFALMVNASAGAILAMPALEFRLEKSSFPFFSYIQNLIITSPNNQITSIESEFIT